MKPFGKRYKNLIRLGWAGLLSVALCGLGLYATAFAFLFCFQLLEFAMSKRRAMCFTAAFTPEQVKEFEKIINELKEYGGLFKDLADLAKLEGGLAALKALPAALKKHGDEFEQLKSKLKEVQRILAARTALSGTRAKGRLSNEAAAQLGCQFICHIARKGHLETCVPDQSLRNALVSETRSLLGLSEEKVLGTADIPLPVQYFSEIRDLIAEYGVVRGIMTPWPLSGGTDAPPRGKTRFGLTKTGGMNQQFAEKNVQIEFASLESHKVGGIIYTPRELREQSIVMLGQYIARLAAVAAAQVEDEYGFLSDGTATYDSISGVVKVANTNGKVITLAAGKTSPSDVARENFRGIFAKVNSRVRATGQWYMNNTWEAFLTELNTQANQYVFRYNNAGEPLLYGRKINWVEVLQEYSEDAAPSKPIAVFGDLSYWWFGTRAGGLRIDESSDFKFDYDLIATRMIEEFDFDYMAIDAAGVVQTPAV